MLKLLMLIITTAVLTCPVEGQQRTIDCWNALAARSVETSVLRMSSCDTQARTIAVVALDTAKGRRSPWLYPAIGAGVGAVSLLALVISIGDECSDCRHPSAAQRYLLGYPLVGLIGAAGGALAGHIVDGLVREWVEGEKPERQ